MAKSYQSYLDSHDGNAEEALRAAVADIGKRENQNTAARAFKRAYSPLVESLKLPVDVDTDSEAEAQTLAARAAETLSKPAPAASGDEDAQATIEALRDLLDVYAANTGIDPEDVMSALDTLPEDATDEQVDAAVNAAFQPLAALQDRAARADLQDAAAALGKPVDALADYLQGKEWGKQTVKGQDGTESEVWGIGSGDAFRPLADLPGVQAIGAAAPQPKPTLPTTQKGGPAAPVNPVDNLNKQLFGTPSKGVTK